MNAYTTPVYLLDGREYRTVAGLCKALERKHGARSVSGVSSERKVCAFGVADKVLAVYRVSPPEIGKPMVLTLEGGAA
jgi:hypothetical protein